MSLFSLRSDASNVMQALIKSQAVIEFTLEGEIISANENFCTALGYSLSEIKGKHHSIFIDPEEARKPSYAEFWASLKKGKFQAGEFRRIAKNGSDVFISASYNPVFSGSKPYKVLKIASDITCEKNRAIEDAGKLAALARIQAVIEFTPEGKILTANENFLKALGYTLEEIQGKHHSMFCQADYTRSEAYRRFWQELSAGKLQADEFLRIGKGGKSVWIQASYNPIFDAHGRVSKVVKFATEVTGRVVAVDTLGKALTELAHGDVSQHLTVEFPENLLSLREDFNQSMVKLSEALGEVGCNALAIGQGANEIRMASNELSQRTEQQAASIEQTAAALEEITTAVTDSSRRAEDASKFVAQTRRDAELSSQVVTKAISAMGEIENSSREISSIIGVIDDIAFQTNLLALNAGVEAARAGEAGKGFAVVAQEVRELAQRSAKAAKEIKALITKSSEQVQTGVGLVGRTGEALSTIAEQVESIDLNVRAIVEAAREQAIGLKEINEAVISMDQGTQKNAAMVEESNAASHGLANEVEALNKLLSTFRTGNAMQAHRPAASAMSIPAVAKANVKRPQMIIKASASRGNAAVAQSANSWEEF